MTFIVTKPALVPARGTQLIQPVEKLNMAMQMLGRSVGDPLQSAVRLGELVDAGILKTDQNGNIVSGDGAYVKKSGDKMTGPLEIHTPLWNTMIMMNDNGPFNAKRSFLQVRGDNGAFSFGHTDDSALTIQAEVTLMRDGVLIPRVPGMGYVSLNPGSSVNPGYIAWHTTDGTRRGYLGWGNGVGGELLFTTENTYNLRMDTYLGVNRPPVAGDGYRRVAISGGLVVDGGFATVIMVGRDTTAEWHQYVLADRLRFWDNTAGVDRAILDSGGLEVLGAIRSTGTSATLYCYDRSTARQWAWYGQADIFRFFNGSGDIMTITSAGAVTALSFTPTSDRRVKILTGEAEPRENLADQFVLFDYNFVEGGDYKRGLIAQDVQAYAPEYVPTLPSGYYGLDAVGLLTEAVAGLARRVQRLENAA